MSKVKLEGVMSKSSPKVAVDSSKVNTAVCTVVTEAAVTSITIDFVSLQLFPKVSSVIKLGFDSL